MTTVQQEVNAVIEAANERQRAFRAIDLEAQLAAQQESSVTDRQDQAATDPASPPGANWQLPERVDFKLEESRNTEKIALMPAPPTGERPSRPNRDRKTTSGISMLSPNVRALPPEPRAARVADRTQLRLCVLSQVERVMQKKQAEEDMLRAAFARLDEDGSGTLDKKEVRATPFHFLRSSVAVTRARLLLWLAGEEDGQDHGRQPQDRGAAQRLRADGPDERGRGHVQPVQEVVVHEEGR